MSDVPDPDLPIRPVERLSAPLAALEQLRLLIQDGTLRPGDKLPPERRLAEMLGVSRPTLREALSALALLNVVETRQGSGRVVNEVDLDRLSAPFAVLVSLLPPERNVEAVLEMRAAIESGLARLAATRISDEALEEYRQRLALLDAATDAPDVLAHDMVLHQIIARESGSPLLAWVLEAFRDLAVVARSRTVQAAGVKESVAADQHRIYEALARRDPEGAAEAMWQHLWRIRTAYARTRPAAPADDDDKETDTDAHRA